MVDRWGVEPLNVVCDAIDLTIGLNSPLNWRRGRDFHPHDEFAYNPTTVGSGYPSKLVALDVCRAVLGLDDPS